MDKRNNGHSVLFSALILFLSISLLVTGVIGSCEETLKRSIKNPYNSYYFLWRAKPTVNEGVAYWFNATVWDGYMLVPEVDKVASECLNPLGNVLAIKGKRPEFSAVTNKVVEVQLCSLNERRECVRDLIANVIMCGGSLFYNLPEFEHVEGDTEEHFVCFERMYTEGCKKDANALQPINNIYDNVMTFTLDQYGWSEAFFKGRQFVFPSLDDLRTVTPKCSFIDDDLHYFLKDPLPDDIGEDPIRLAACRVEVGFSGETTIGECYNYIYVRSCNGKLQFDLSMTYFRKQICFIYKNNIKVRPEIFHEEDVIIEDGKEMAAYTPFLQYRCAFYMAENNKYIVKWYVDGLFRTKTGPSSNADDLVFKVDFLDNLKDRYEVQCGMYEANENEATESRSEKYFAGWKISNKNINLSKSGGTTVTIEQTIPIGCSYKVGAAANCLETLSFEDVINKAGNCGGIKVINSDDPSKSFIEIKSLKKGEKWANKKYNVKLSTIDNNYDDKTFFDLQLTLAYNSNADIGKSITTKVIGSIKVTVTDIGRHWNKRCYSHVDPHMKTADGKHYEAQKEGDYMLLMNKEYQTEIQTSARYCSAVNKTGPVCTCGIAIAVGATKFIINRCHNTSLKFDVSCDDGAIIDIERVHDYRYLVRTPIGTIVEIFILGDVMNIDVYMSPKDYGKVDGLCGSFDGNRDNDLEHRNGTISHDDNKSYRFADSWRLSDEENLFKNPNRKLEKWNQENAGNTDRSCGNVNSITKTKCRIKSRQRRSTPEIQEINLRRRLNSLLARKKRSVRSFTENEAFRLCNDSIYTTPAVQDFPDKLAKEDPEVVVEQCVYDLTQGNDSAWINAHVSALNYATDTILRLNPAYVSANMNKVTSFRIKTCLNDCSGNGICRNTGLCECSGSFRGPDCSLDIRIPPVIYEIDGEEVCTITDDDDCTCFQIRTDNIFDGFVCNISENKVYFNGTRVQEKTAAKGPGRYEDIFTGECCVPTGSRNGSNIVGDKHEELSVRMYEFSVSNDGVNHGETNLIYVYDPTCIQQVQTGERVTFKLKVNYCLISGSCFPQNYKVPDSRSCHICDPSANPYSWTKDNCDESTTALGGGRLLESFLERWLFSQL